MAHPKTIEAFDTILGEKGDWKRRYEKGHEVATQAKKELIAKDPDNKGRCGVSYSYRRQFRIHMLESDNHRTYRYRE
jgi:hypothetical protein